jgi:hypothetical protein
LKYQREKLKNESNLKRWSSKLLIYKYQNKGSKDDRKPSSQKRKLKTSPFHPQNNKNTINPSQPNPRISQSYLQ